MEIAQSLLDRLFSELRIIHKAHWKAPKIEDVQKEITARGVFVFRIGRDPYVAELRITKDEVHYEVNTNLPERMRKQAEEMKAKFDSQFKQS